MCPLIMGGVANLSPLSFRGSFYVILYVVCGHVLFSFYRPISFGFMCISCICYRNSFLSLFLFVFVFHLFFRFLILIAGKILQLFFFSRFFRLFRFGFPSMSGRRKRGYVDVGSSSIWVDIGSSSVGSEVVVYIINYYFRHLLRHNVYAYKYY